MSERHRRNSLGLCGNPPRTIVCFHSITFHVCMKYWVGFRANVSVNAPKTQFFNMSSSSYSKMSSKSSYWKITKKTITSHFNWHSLDVSNRKKTIDVRLDWHLSKTKAKYYFGKTNRRQKLTQTSTNPKSLNKRWSYEHSSTDIIDINDGKPFITYIIGGKQKRKRILKISILVCGSKPMTSPSTSWL